jgi:hypothetical protein
MYETHGGTLPSNLKYDWCRSLPHENYYHQGMGALQMNEDTSWLTIVRNTGLTGEVYMTSDAQSSLEECVAIFNSGGREQLEAHIKAQRSEFSELNAARFSGLRQRHLVLIVFLACEIVHFLVPTTSERPRRLTCWISQPKGQSVRLLILDLYIIQFPFSIRQKLEALGYEREMKHILATYSGIRFFNHPQVRKSQILTDKGNNYSKTLGHLLTLFAQCRKTFKHL